MPVARTLLPLALPHWQCASDSDTFEEKKKKKEVCGFYLLLRELHFISESDCFWNIYNDWFLSLLFQSIVIGCATAKLATVKNQNEIGNSAGKCNRKKQNKTNKTPSIYSIISILILACLYVQNPAVSSISVYPSLVHAKACEYEHYTDYENKYFHCIRLYEAWSNDLESEEELSCLDGWLNEAQKQ